MSDRYLCKAKRTDNREWVEGNLVWSEDADEEYRAVIIPKTKSNMFISSNEEDLGFETWYLVDPETVCQYTGLHDGTRWEELSEKEQQQFSSEWNYEKDRKNQKEDWNGKKIWENDIVETVYDGKLNPNYVVVWDKDDLGFLASNGEEHYKTNCEYLGCCDEIIVIGNIFDNPELLGGGTV